MGPVKVILNPVAGRGYGAKIEPALQQLLKEQGLEFDLVRTDRPGQAVELAQQAVSDGYETVVAAGGDGTANEVVNGLMIASNGKKTNPLGIIPVGSGSDFSYAVDVPPDLADACRFLANGNTRLIDVGRLAMPGRPPRYFDNTVGIGFDAIVTMEALKVKRLRGMALYLPVVLKTVFLYGATPTVMIEYDGTQLSLPAMMIVIANGPREGGGFLVAPHAQPDDGLFDLCITRELSRLGMLRMIPLFMNGSHVDKEPVTMARAKRVTITSPGDLIVHMDGEMVATDARRLEFEIIPQRLQVRC
jgi:YegS/Rv2252/BmrU family lipid kinase